MIHKILLSSLMITLFIACATQDNDEVADTSHLYYNGDIITMHSEKPTYVEALVEEDGKIMFVGSLKDAKEKFTHHKLIDLEGKTMLPGFIDPHSHFGMVSSTMGQVDLNPPPVGSVSDIEDIQHILLEYKEENDIPDGEWIFGWGYDDGQLSEKRHPNKSDIDEVLPDNPVYLQHTSGHMGVANSLALEKMNIDASSQNPDGGNIARMKKVASVER